MYWLICLRPCSPSFLRASSLGETDDINCMMIDAEMYGMMLSAKIAMRSIAPPAKRFTIPRMPDEFWRNVSAKATGSMPGIGMKVPMR